MNEYAGVGPDQVVMNSLQDTKGKVCVKARCRTHACILYTT